MTDQGLENQKFDAITKNMALQPYFYFLCICLFHAISVFISSDFCMDN